MQIAALTKHSIIIDDLNFNMLKLQILERENDDDKTFNYLNYLIAKYPANADLKQKLTQLKIKSDSDRIGINYNYTAFSRSMVLGSLLRCSIRERKKITLISRLSYADRQSFGNSISSGIQYEFETYIKTIKKVLTLIPSATIQYSRNYDLFLFS
jgi:hypothetical protein